MNLSVFKLNYNKIKYIITRQVDVYQLQNVFLVKSFWLFYFSTHIYFFLS